MWSLCYGERDWQCCKDSLFCLNKCAREDFKNDSFCDNYKKDIAIALIGRKSGRSKGSWWRQMTSCSPTRILLLVSKGQKKERIKSYLIWGRIGRPPVHLSHHFNLSQLSYSGFIVLATHIHCTQCTAPHTISVFEFGIAMPLRKMRDDADYAHIRAYMR